MFFPAWCGLYTQMSNNPSFIRGGLDNISRTIKAEMADAGTVTEEDKDMAKIYRIRKLTPKECFRLMGLHDSDIDAIQKAGISESQQYKLAGNSIVVNVMEGIFTQMFRADSECLF